MKWHTLPRGQAQLPPRLDLQAFFIGTVRYCQSTLLPRKAGAKAGTSATKGSSIPASNNRTFKQKKMMIYFLNFEIFFKLKNCIISINIFY